MAPRNRRSASSTTYDSELRATDAELDFIRGLGTHLETPRADRLRMLLDYLKTLDWPHRDWGRIDREMVRFAVEVEIQRETKARGRFVPTNGHGLVGAREYARRAGEVRREIRRDESEDSE